MANKDKPFGFRPVRHLNGNPWNGQFNMYYIAALYGTALYVGDAVSSAGSADTLGKYATIARGATTTYVRGVIIGFSNTPNLAADVTDLTTVYSPALTAGYAAVVDDPDVIFQVQEDNDSENMEADDVGRNFDYTTTAGSAVTGLSAMELDSSDNNTTALPCRLMGLSDIPGNAMGDYAVWDVLFVMHELRSTTGV